MTDRTDVTGSWEAGDRGIGFLLYHVNLAWQRTLAEAFAPLRITHAQFAVLTAAQALGARGTLPLQRDVAEDVGFHPTQTSTVMAVLLERGWATRVADQQDGRASRVRITAEGARIAAEATLLLHAAEARFFPRDADTRALELGLRSIANRSADDAAAAPHE